jgi:hypothetical protein
MERFAACDLTLCLPLLKEREDPIETIFPIAGYEATATFPFSFRRRG